MNKKFVLVLAAYALLAILFYYTQTSNVITGIYRGAGISGMTFLAVSLLITPLAIFFKPLAKHVMLRIESGVFGFLLIVVHAIVLFVYTFKFDITLHFTMPVLLAATIALTIYAVMTATGGAENMKKLGFKTWKLVHRFGYLAFLLAVYHFWSKYPAAITEPFGIIMLGVVAFTIIGQVAGAIKKITTKTGAV